MRLMMRYFISILVSLIAFSVWADSDARLDMLEKKVADLEKRLDELETSTAPVVATVQSSQTRDYQRSKARSKIKEDSNTYSQQELEEIEELYQVARDRWGTNVGKASLKKLIAKYGKANMTGCAVLDLGLMSSGRDKEKYLNQAINGYSDSFYPDGVQVGAYARFQLALHHKSQGDDEKAQTLFDEVIDKYPNAIDPRGRYLRDQIKREQ
ncbi:hypothetical protein BVX97_01475 [bacterium E08(2017)]|nr:hypothetical protein BVX97_01475 [bacterium E08(2017)]